LAVNSINNYNVCKEHGGECFIVTYIITNVMPYTYLYYRTEAAVFYI